MVDDIIGVDEPATIDKKLQTYSNVVGANTVHAEAVVQVDSTSTPVPTGTAASPVRTDPTGTTPQPVSGTVTSNAGTGNFNVAINQTGTNNDVDVVSTPTGASATQVQGTAADGVPPVGNPVLMAGSDGTNVQNIQTDTAGKIQTRIFDSGGSGITVTNPLATRQSDGAAFYKALDDAKLPTAALLAENLTNPTTTQIAALTMGFDGTAWDRLRSDSDSTNLSPLAAGVLRTIGHLYGFDGTDWIRLQTNGSLSPILRVANDGTIAHDAVDSGNPVKIGGIARTANPTAVAALDRVNAFYDDVGRQVVVPNQVRDLVIRPAPTTISTTTETTILAAGAAGVFHDVTLLTISNTSATDVRVDIRDATAGTVQFPIFVKAGGFVGFSLTTPTPQTTAANNWTAQLSAAVTDVRITIQAVKNV